MKKIKILIVAILLVGAAKATPVKVSIAQNVAEKFYINKYSVRTPDMKLVYTEKDANGQPLYYIFNVNARQGFVIVAADDAAHPIIGYSNENPFVIPASNNNAHFWLQQRKNEIIAMRAHNVTASSYITDEWASYTSNAKGAISNAVTTGSVLPLCKTYWNQLPYYNAMCPGGSVTGCVATAMAQIMKYWAYPAVGTGSNCYYEETQIGYQENYGELCETFDTSHYNWSAMPDNLGDTNYEVAKIMYDCGISVDMDYSPSESGASVMGRPSAEYAYTAYFGYDASTINSAMYSNSRQASFISLVENELNDGRPVQFEGTDPVNGGHSWVCDGYSANSNDMHMNWGWGGADNGYYAITSLNPSPYDFSQEIGVIYGIEPPSKLLAVKEISDNTSIKVYPNPSNGVFNFVMSLNNNNSYQINVYNVLGQQVAVSGINSGNGQINLGSQPKGIYIYRVLTQTGEPVSTGRLVVE